MYLIISVLVLISAGLIFGIIAENVVKGDALTIVDVQIGAYNIDSHRIALQS